MTLATLTYINAPLGWLIYAAIIVLGISFLLLLYDRTVTGQATFAIGFVLSLAAVVLRTIQVRQVPLQSMFEVFLAMGMLCWPLSLLWRKLGVRGQAIDPFLAVVVLFPAGFVFQPTSHPLMPALQSPLFLPHVLAYLISYVTLAKAGLEALSALVPPKQLEPSDAKPSFPILSDRLVELHRLVLLAFPFMTIGLLLGAIWGKLAWGHWWNWDPKELWSLASWLIYVIYLHLHGVWGKRHSRVQAALLIIGFAAVVFTLLWINLAPKLQSLHAYAG